MRRSYRNRGYEVRVDKNSRTKRAVDPNKVKILGLKNKALVIIHINKMFDISAKNKSPNLPELYSILNPDTNSLSPSAKSKGARFVSEIIVITQTTSKGKFNRTNGNLWSPLIR